MSREFSNLTNEDAKKNGWDIIKPFKSEVVGKAVYREIAPDGSIEIMKSTKRLEVEGGWIYNTSTEVHKGGRVSVAEALVFVPYAMVVPYKTRETSCETDKCDPAEIPKV